MPARFTDDKSALPTLAHRDEPTSVARQTDAPVMPSVGSRIFQSLCAATAITLILIIASCGYGLYVSPFIFAAALTLICVDVEVSLLAYRLVVTRKRRYIFLLVFSYLSTFASVFGFGILNAIYGGYLQDYNFEGAVYADLAYSLIGCPLIFASLWYIAAPDIVIPVSRGFPVITAHNDEVMESR